MFPQMPARYLAVSAATAFVHASTSVVLSVMAVSNLAVVVPLAVGCNIILVVWLAATGEWIRGWLSGRLVFAFSLALFLLVSIINPFIRNLVFFAHFDVVRTFQWFLTAITRPHAWIEFGSIGIALVNPGKWAFKTQMAVIVPLLLLAGILEFGLLSLGVGH